MVQMNMLEDETDILQYGVTKQTNFYTNTMLSSAVSSWNKFPTPENPLTRYKFTSFEVNFSPDFHTISR